MEFDLDHHFLPNEVESLHQSITVGHARLPTLSERDLLLRHVRELKDVDIRHLETTGQDFHAKITIDQAQESVPDLQFGALNMFLALDLPSHRVALRLRFIRIEWLWLIPAPILQQFVILANRLPNHLQVIVTDLHLDELTHLYRFHPRVKHFPTVSARLNLSAGAILRLSVSGMISVTDRLLTLGRTRKWVAIKDRAIRMAIHAVLPMAQVAFTTMDRIIATHLRFHRQRQFQCLLTIVLVAQLFSRHPPVHVVVHPLAERARGTAHTADLHPAEVIHPNLPIMGRLLVIKITILVSTVLLKALAVRISIPTVHLRSNLGLRSVPTTAPQLPIRVPNAFPSISPASLQLCLEGN